MFGTPTLIAPGTQGSSMRTTRATTTHYTKYPPLVARRFCEGYFFVHDTKLTGSFKASAGPAQDQDKTGITRRDDLHIGVGESLNRADIIKGGNLLIQVLTSGLFAGHNLTRRSGQEVFKISRVGSAHAGSEGCISSHGSDRDTLARPDPTRPTSFDLTREQPS